MLCNIFYLPFFPFQKQGEKLKNLLFLKEKKNLFYLVFHEVLVSFSTVRTVCFGIINVILCWTCYGCRMWIVY